MADIKLKDVTKLVSGIATVVNSFFSEDAVDVAHDNDSKKTSVKLKGSAIGKKGINFGMDFEDESTRERALTLKGDK